MTRSNCLSMCSLPTVLGLVSGCQLARAPEDIELELLRARRVEFFFFAPLCVLASGGLGDSYRGGPDVSARQIWRFARGASQDKKAVVRQTRAAYGPSAAPLRPLSIGETPTGLVVGVTQKTVSRLVQRRVKARCSAKVLSSRSGAPRGRRAHAVAFRRGAEALLPHTSPQTAPRSAGNR